MAADGKINTLAPRVSTVEGRATTSRDPNFEVWKARASLYISMGASAQVVCDSNGKMNF